MSRNLGHVTSPVTILADRLGVLPSQLRRIGYERFLAMSEDAQKIMVNQMKQTTMSRKKVAA